jgi:AraC family transcriptional regulator of adaptative response / DNA-3-methyladenine glycosylase II
MNLDPRICSQARLSRDARFDGRFFVAVLSTRIYCRPVCPVRTAKEENVRYFPNAAAATEAGFRPCLRCRPELSPGAPAWQGTSTTVSRALRLISENSIEDESVESLAARLGIGSRQLRRLFVRHLGASPITVMKTRRLHFAKKLIDETTLPIGQIAAAAGFGSARRLNSVFRQTYQRTPTQVRRLAAAPAVQDKNEYQFRLCFRPPLHWEALLSFLAQRVIVGVEAVAQRQYLRLISFDGHVGRVTVSMADEGSVLNVGISFPESRWLFVIVERLRRMFDLTADPREIASALSTDPLLSSCLSAMPGLRVPGCWDGFEMAVRAILGQQVTVAGANTLAARLVRKFGVAVNTECSLTHLFPTPKVLARADLADIGLPKTRALTIRALAQTVCEGQISFHVVNNFEDFQSRLLLIPGIGNWTAQYIAMRALGDPDAFPASDLGLLKAASVNSERALLERAEAWRPWRAYAAMYLWQSAPAIKKPRRATLIPARIDDVSVAAAR